MGSNSVCKQCCHNRTKLLWLQTELDYMQSYHPQVHLRNSFHILKYFLTCKTKFNSLFSVLILGLQYLDENNLYYSKIYFLNWVQSLWITYIYFLLYCYKQFGKSWIVASTNLLNLSIILLLHYKCMLRKLNDSFGIKTASDATRLFASIWR